MRPENLNFCLPEDTVAALSHHPHHRVSPETHPSFGSLHFLQSSMFCLFFFRDIPPGWSACGRSLPLGLKSLKFQCRVVPFSIPPTQCQNHIVLLLWVNIRWDTGRCLSPGNFLWSSYALTKSRTQKERQMSEPEGKYISAGTHCTFSRESLGDKETLQEQSE